MSSRNKSFKIEVPEDHVTFTDKKDKKDKKNLHRSKGSGRDIVVVDSIAEVAYHTEARSGRIPGSPRYVFIPKTVDKDYCALAHVPAPAPVPAPVPTRVKALASASVPAPVSARSDDTRRGFVQIGGVYDDIYHIPTEAKTVVRTGARAEARTVVRKDA